MLRRLRRVLGRLRKFCEESFVVELVVGEAVHSMPCRWSAYAADPFVLEESGRRWVYFEEFDYWKGKGRICCRELAGFWGPLQVVLDQAGHLSFPFLFRHAEQWWMIPESSDQQRIDLYCCRSLPLQWERVACLLDNIDAVDTVLHYHDQLWWLFTFAASEPGQARHLQIYSSSALPGPWRAHPVNRSRLYAGLPFQSGRNAGALFDFGGRLVRPFQQSAHCYGEGLALAEVVCLNQDKFTERPCVHLPRWPSHHVHRASTAVARDRRTRFPFFSNRNLPGDRP